MNYNYGENNFGACGRTEIFLRLKKRSNIQVREGGSIEYEL